MKTARTLLCLLAAALLALPLNALGEETPFELLSRSTTIYTSMDGKDYTTTTFFDERGLVTAMEQAQDSGESQSGAFHYEFDDWGNPVAFSAAYGEESFEAVIENTYASGLLFEGRRIVEAEITGLRVDGEEVPLDEAAEDPDSLSASTASALMAPINVLQNFVGYRDTALRLAGNEIRYSAGRIVYSRQVMPGMLQEMEYDYLPDGGTTTKTTLSMWQDGEWNEMSVQVMTTDAGNFLVDLGEAGTVRYEDSVDPETGEKLRLGYVQSQEDAAGDELIARYTLDEAGGARRAAIGENTVMYYEEGRLIRQETWVGDQLRAAIENTYR